MCKRKSWMSKVEQAGPPWDGGTGLEAGEGSPDPSARLGCELKEMGKLRHGACSSMAIAGDRMGTAWILDPSPVLGLSTQALAHPSHVPYKGIRRSQSRGHGPRRASATSLTPSVGWGDRGTLPQRCPQELPLKQWLWAPHPNPASPSSCCTPLLARELGPEGALSSPSHTGLRLLSLLPLGWPKPWSGVCGHEGCWG